MVATIGYERASLADFIATLKLAKIDVLVDVRDRAQSRRPGFSKSALCDALRSEGIRYLHMRELGDPKAGREAARRGDFVTFRKIFGEVMRSVKAREAIKKLEELASTDTICLMCFERDQATCHRTIVADCLEKTLNLKTQHLGVKEGVGSRSAVRRMHDTHQGAAAPFQSLF